MLDDFEDEDFKKRVRGASTGMLMEAYNDAMTSRWVLPPWQIHILDEELNRRRRQAKIREAAEGLEKMAKACEQTKTTTKKPKKKLKKEETTMATETKNIKVNTKIDINAIIQAKMAEKMMDAVGTGKDIPLTKMTIMQGITSGKGIDINEIIQAKQTEKLLKDLDSGKELTIGQLMTYQALTSGDGLDINALVQAKFVEKLFDETEDKK